ncbi:unnamed protein product [Durusdinium trenchii]|uniref:Uncharacterized protein n=1 Tax=Durusdinium trenchii TaxID=1381693 RepID=A0ABP0N560_9DINO
MPVLHEMTNRTATDELSDESDELSDDSDEGSETSDGEMESGEVRSERPNGDDSVSNGSNETNETQSFSDERPPPRQTTCPWQIVSGQTGRVRWEREA